MKIIIYGLGIIGASLAAALIRAGHTVLGKNRSRGPVEYALEHHMIDGEAASYEGADVVFLCLPPDATMQELNEGAFPSGCIVSDICGVKEVIEKAVYEKPRNYRYVGTHPMAGKETSGILSASEDLYRGKNLVITVNEYTDPAALDTIRSLAQDAGFGRIMECSAREHDAKIALTSQLAHIVSNAYGKSPLCSFVSGFTGGSFQDMTRVGGVDENLWCDLYFYARDPLLQELSGLIERLKEFEQALKTEDREGMRALLRVGRLAHDRFFSEK